MDQTLILPFQRALDLGQYAAGVVPSLLARIEQVMGDEFRRQGLGRRPGKGLPVTAWHQASR